MLQEILLSIIILSLIFSFSISKIKLIDKHSREESPVIFMGSAIRAMRDSEEDMHFRTISIFDNKIYYKNKITNKTEIYYLEDDIRVSAKSIEDISMATDPFFRINVSALSGYPGEIKFKRKDKIESKIMINFGSYVFDIR